jgi:hypothetical protein
VDLRLTSHEYLVALTGTYVLYSTLLCCPLAAVALFRRFRGEKLITYPSCSRLRVPFEPAPQEECVPLSSPTTPTSTDLRLPFLSSFLPLSLSPLSFLCFSSPSCSRRQQRHPPHGHSLGSLLLLHRARRSFSDFVAECVVLSMLSYIFFLSHALDLSCSSAFGVETRTLSWKEAVAASCSKEVVRRRFPDLLPLRCCSSFSHACCQCSLLSKFSSSGRRRENEGTNAFQARDETNNRKKITTKKRNDENTKAYVHSHSLLTLH